MKEKMIINYKMNILENFNIKTLCFFSSSLTFLLSYALTFFKN
jgi:hypothetical protein